MKTIWNKQTGEAKAYEGVDAREILANSPDIYTDVDPIGADATDPDGDGFEGGPQNVANVENEFRREPVGDDVPAPERDVTIIRNPVTDQPPMAPLAAEHPEVNNTPAQPTVLATVVVPAADPLDHDVDGKKGGAVDLDGMTVAQLTEHAKGRNIDLGDATLKADIRAAIDLANGQ